MKLSEFRLQPLERKHLILLLELRNQPDNLKWLQNQRLISEKEQYNWYEKLDPNRFQQFIVFFQNEAIGEVHLKEIHLDSRSAECGIMMDKNSKGTGMAFAASYLLLSHAFEVLQLQSITAKVHPKNETVKKYNQFLGFEFCRKTEDGFEYYEMNRTKFPLLVEKIKPLIELTL